MAYEKIPTQWPFQPPPNTPRIAFVGEAPAEEELLEGHPLVGAPGRLMGQLLRTAGLTRTDPMPLGFYPELAQRGLRPLLWERSHFLWTNVFDEKLPDNEVKNWCAAAPEAKEWEDYTLERIESAGYLRPDYQSHLGRLRKELRDFNPNLIVPLGGTALWAFTGSSSIQENRGAVARASLLLPGTKLLPTLHPANVLHQYKMFSVVVADLVKASREALFPEIRLPKRELWIAPTIEDLWAFKARYLDRADIISIDIETAAGNHITCIGFGCLDGKAITVPFVDYRQPSRSYWPTEEQELEAWRFIEEICQSPKEKLMQNGPYDFYFLWRAAGIKIRNYAHDTRLMHHALWPELPKSLSFMGACYTNQNAWKKMREKKEFARDK